MNTFPFEMIGDEAPRPGIGVFHKISLGPIATGMLAPVAVPSPSGPRKRFQSAANRLVDTTAIARRAMRCACISMAWQGVNELTTKITKRHKGINYELISLCLFVIFVVKKQQH